MHKIQDFLPPKDVSVIIKYVFLITIFKLLKLDIYSNNVPEIQTWGSIGSFSEMINHAVDKTNVCENHNVEKAWRSKGSFGSKSWIKASQGKMGWTLMSQDDKSSTRSEWGNPIKIQSILQLCKPFNLATTSLLEWWLWCHLMCIYHNFDSHITKNDFNLKTPICFFTFPATK